MPEKLNALTPIEKFITKEVPYFPITQNAKAVKTLLLNQPELFRRIGHVYFHDAAGRLVGFASLRKLSLLADDTNLAQYIKKDIARCFSDSSIEKAVSIAIHRKVTDLPIVDKMGRLKGVVVSETLLRIIGELYAGKTYKHGGIVHNETLYDLVNKGSVAALVMARFPWLLVGLFGVLIAANIVGNFENMLSLNLVLALFIPAVTYMSDAVGTQSETLYIRTLAIKEDELNIFKYIFRDVVTTFFLGIIIGGILGTIVYVWKADVVAAWTIGITMVINITVSSFIATMTPTFFRYLGKDPAIMSGPLSTIIQDIVSLMVYFMTAFMVYRFIG